MPEPPDLLTPWPVSETGHGICLSKLGLSPNKLGLCMSLRRIPSQQTNATLAPFESSGGSCRDGGRERHGSGTGEIEVVAAHAGRRL